jgi:hypothetical protein
MKLSHQLFVIAVLIVCGPSVIRGQTEPASGAILDSTKPYIDKIDPPGWWATLPDPMLLVHGENLNSATFQVTGTSVKLTRTQVSDNGHWAFLWLATKDANPQTIQVNARNKDGEVHYAFTLARRMQGQDAPRGFSSADVLYLIMTDRFAHAPQANAMQDLDRSDPRGWHGGNLTGIEQHLDYLHELGVTTLWTTPVASNAGMRQSYHGYAATDLYAIDPHVCRIISIFPMPSMHAA